MSEQNQGYNAATYIGRDTSKGINELIISLMSDIAWGYKKVTSPSELEGLERSTHMLETILGVQDSEQWEEIKELREEQAKHSPPTTNSKRVEFRKALVKRIDNILNMMGRKGLLPSEVKEEVIQRPTSWK